MNKTAIKNFAVWAREKLIADIKYKASMMGISEKGIAEELPQSANDLKFFDIGTRNYAEVSGKEIKQRETLVSAIKVKQRDTKDYKEAYEFIIEEVAYTWFNRLIAIRFMEVNDYLPFGVRVLSSEKKAKNEPDLVTNPFEADLDLTSLEQEKIIELKDENKSDELFRMLFIKQCNKLHEILPDIFEKTDDYSELLLTISFTDTDGIIYKLVHEISEDDFNIEKEGQIEIIGWLYQYYNIEPKKAVFARKKDEKIKKEQIPAATQLFTPKWIVRYMVENSLGRLWYEGHNNSTIKDNWKYYIEEAEQEPEVQEKLDAIKEEYKTMKPEDIKLIDPCMGSGHILVYAFDVFMQIYESYGYTQRDAARLIVENNIYGLDIDERAAQLAYFAVMMKGRQYDRRFLTRGIKPHIYDVPELERVDTDIIHAFGDCADIARRVCDSFIDGKEYGSLISPAVSLDEIERLNNKLEEMNTEITDIFTLSAINTVTLLMDVVTMLVQKYDVVITNPPYMLLSNADDRLASFITKNYSDSKADLFAVFIEKCNVFLKKFGIQSLITMHSWMFLASFELLREKIQKQVIINMIHLGPRAFEEIGGEVVQTTAFTILKQNLPKYKGTYARLVFPTTRSGKEKMFLQKENIYISVQDSFEKIPGIPIAYWWGNSIYHCFSEGKFIPGNPMKGIQTGKGEKYLRFWYEVSYKKMGLNLRSYQEIISLGLKWFPLTSGGISRRWYGNFEMVVNLENNGADIRATGLKNFRLKDSKYYFLEGLTWTEVTTKPFTCRYLPRNILFGNGGPVAFQLNDNLLYSIGLLNSVVAKELFTVLAPTMNYGPDQVRNVPFKIGSKERCEALVESNINASRKDWDSFETSWDFEEHPLIRLSKNLWDTTSIEASMLHYYGDYPKISCPLELCFMLWQGECNERFNKLKKNEEELNRIFIEIYGLQDELTPEVEDKDVTVRKADLQRDIKSLISYAVGCMFGRYSLDVDGLAFAGGEWEKSKYSTYIPDADNCIPVTDEEYFEDDIVGRFVEFVKVVFGEEDLEANLKYIANALGNKGITSRDAIRNYFLNTFIKDHIKTYQKRPIYWMFDSGKQNGFKALVYMHRWNADTIGNMRVEYLHRMQKVYDKEIERMQEIIDNSNDNKEVNKAIKRKEKLQKQLKETKDYDAFIAHLALSRIDIDLDDGVKVNYEKVQTPPDGKKMQILTNI